MKLKALLLALLVAGVCSSAALAEKGPAPDKGKPEAAAEHGKGHGKRDACHPSVSLVLKGTFVSAGTDSFVMTVKKANKHGRFFAGKDAPVTVNAETKFRRGGEAKLTDLQKGDRLNVQVRACKNADSSKLVLLAKRVVAQPAKAEKGEKDEEKTETGTTTSAS